jgi:pimeloyl-ACP methyl ester carboxylesterase
MTDELEVFESPGDDATLVVAASHPAAVFGAHTAALLADISRRRAVCINPRAFGGVSFADMVDALEATRGRLGLPPWVFWGMSGGGWLAQLYARRHPAALAGIIVESACVCFRERLADPECVLSPFFPAWRTVLAARGLIAQRSHAHASAADDAEWIEVENVGQVFRRPGGPALLVAPMPIDDAMKRAMPQLWRFDARAWIGQVTTPALVIAGSADPVVPVARVREVHDAIAGSRFVEVEGGGHVPSAAGSASAVEAIRGFLSELA